MNNNLSYQDIAESQPRLFAVFRGYPHSAGMIID